MMTSAVNFLRCSSPKKTKFISANNGQLLVSAIKGTESQPQSWQVRVDADIIIDIYVHPEATTHSKQYIGSACRFARSSSVV